MDIRSGSVSESTGHCCPGLGWRRRGGTTGRLAQDDTAAGRIRQMKALGTGERQGQARRRREEDSERLPSREARGSRLQEADGRWGHGDRAAESEETAPLPVVQLRRINRVDSLGSD